MKIAILYKGRSSEREVSYKSGKAINTALQALNHETSLIDPSEYSYFELINEIKKFNADLVFNALHGGEGENGLLQGLLELEKIPYTGSDSKACAVAMDKYLCERLVGYYGVPIIEGKIFHSESENWEGKYPIVVKPNDAGSSVGITVVESENQFLPALKTAFQYSSSVICQEFIKGRELTVPILDDEPLPVIEIKPKYGFFDFENKYTKGSTDYIIPAEITKEETEEIQRLAVLVYKAVGAEVYSRIDFRYDGEKFYFLEINTLPGMTDTSLVPMSANAIGMSFESLVDKIVTLSLDKK